MGLKYIPNSELDKLRQRPEMLAHALRINALYMVSKIGKGHLGTSLSSMEAIVAIWEAMENQDIFLSSKGHDAVAQYVMLIYQGYLNEDDLNNFRIEDGLPGHPTVDVPGIAANTGSLGMGLSKAFGLAHDFNGTVYVLLGDGEMMEGQNWEAALAAINTKATNLVALIDVNGFSQDGKTALAADQIERMFLGAGWGVLKAKHGNNYYEVAQLLNTTKELRDSGPWAIILMTTKGVGISEFADSPKSHFGPPKDYDAAFNDLLSLLPKNVNYIDTEIHPKLNTKSPAAHIVELAATIQELMEEDERIVVVGADTLEDVHLGNLKNNFPSRVFDFGIAEQNAVSFASGLALRGYIPIVITYACFLRRAFEQIYNQITEETQVIYIGTMAGPLDASGPGISHQSLDDGQYMSRLMYTSTVTPERWQEVNTILREMLKSRKSAYMRSMA